LDTALYGVGAACQAVDDIVDKKYRNAFCLTRPPGHHAIKNSSMGFCLFGNIAIAVKHALSKNGVNKVAIIDFDVHQGNGTEDLVKDDENILFFSIHQENSWPYQHHEDKGPHGIINNIAVPIKSDPSVYHAIFDELIIPALNEWQPDFVFISAGFDAHRDDPPQEDALFNDPPGRQMLLEEDFNTMTRKLMTIADQYADGRLVSIMEGGYNPDILAKCCVAHGKTLADTFCRHISS
jgi:acetoin utilization deacetylase AcuC-like enzyme